MDSYQHLLRNEHQGVAPNLPEIDLAYFNYEHGGLIGAGARGGGAGYDFTGLVRVMGEDDRWPHLIVMGEGDRYEYNGGTGMWGAAAAMRAAGGRPYMPLPCSLPREWGPFAPVIFFDAQTLVVDRFYDHRAPDFAARNRNALIVFPATGGELLHVSTTHGDLYDPALRATDARYLRWLANPDLLSAVLADWNETLSGPQHEPQDLDSAHYTENPHRTLHRLRLGPDGQPEVPHRLATGAMDFLCGAWDEQRGERIGGVGFRDVAELAGLFTGTNLPKPGRQSTQIDHILVNSSLADRIVPGSTRIHEPLDPDHPDSDHKRLSVAVDL